MNGKVEYFSERSDNPLEFHIFRMRGITSDLVAIFFAEEEANEYLEFIKPKPRKG